MRLALARAELQYTPAAAIAARSTAAASASASVGAAARAALLARRSFASHRHRAAQSTGTASFSAALRALFGGPLSLAHLSTSAPHTPPPSPSSGITQPLGNATTMSTLETLNFDNLALRSLPVEDAEPTDLTQRQVPGACFSRVVPTPVENPKTVCVSPEALALIGLAPEETQRPDFADFLSGNKVFPGAQPAAHCYCGHQFGYFSGQLGDGATMYLGEVVNADNQRWEIQFKGAGKTPFSRSADGRKVLRSSIREFLCSEAMHHLGIPTTRAGALVTSDTRVVRDMFYNGNPIMEQASIVLRIAPTFLRFGSFEIVKDTDPTTNQTGPSAGRADITKQLLDYTISTFYPEIPQDSPEKYKLFYKEIVLRTARLAASWQSIGFCHGVLNTDNMSIIGVTIDYGPFGFMERFDAGHICNGSDDSGRYDYQSQPAICKWNLGKLGEVIATTLPLEESRPILRLYDDEFQTQFQDKMRRKVGFIHSQEAADVDLIESLLENMEESAADFTNVFRLLSKIQGEPVEQAFETIKEQLYPVAALAASKRPRFNIQQLQYIMTVPGLAQSIGVTQAIFDLEMRKAQQYAELKDMTEESKLASDAERWSAWFALYKARIERDNEQAMANGVDAPSAARAKAMDSVNPSFVLRNHLAQGAIAHAEDGDFEAVQRLLDELREPFKARESLKRGPEGRLVVTCSS